MGLWRAHYVFVFRIWSVKWGHCIGTITAKSLSIKHSVEINTLKWKALTVCLMFERGFYDDVCNFWICFLYFVLICWVLYSINKRQHYMIPYISHYSKVSKIERRYYITYFYWAKFWAGTLCKWSPKTKRRKLCTWQYLLFVSWDSGSE